MCQLTLVQDTSVKTNLKGSMSTLQNHADHSVQTINLLIMKNGVKGGMNVLARWQMTSRWQKSKLGRLPECSHTLCQPHILPSVLNKCSVMECGISEGAAIPREGFQDVLGGKQFRLPAFDVKQNKYLRKHLLPVCSFIKLNINYY